MTHHPRLITMPKEGLWRVDRYLDLYTFPPAAEPLQLDGTAVDGGGRWEDIDGRFATLKYSTGANGAIGRTIARYRRRLIGGRTFIEVIRDFLSADEDGDTPGLPADNRVPPDYFDDAHLVRLSDDREVEFIDLEHPNTVSFLQELLGKELAGLGVKKVERGIARNRDRRVSRLITSELREFVQRRPEYDNVVGLRYKTLKDAGWDAYVVWEDSELDVSLVSEVRALTPTDDDVLLASRELGLDWP